MRRYASPPSRQRGAVLYIALIMLILLALLGVVAMQVAGRMAEIAAGMTFDAIFQSRIAGPLGADFHIGTGPEHDCTTTHDAAGWDGANAYVRRLDLCFSWGSMDYPSDESERTDQIYQVTGFARDRDGVLASSEAVVDTVAIGTAVLPMC